MWDHDLHAVEFRLLPYHYGNGFKSTIKSGDLVKSCLFQEHFG